MIAVTDSGSGMPADIVAKAFEPFFTTKPAAKGTGLGLSQVFGFVKQSGGHVKIYSELGEGTTIKIYLPRFTGPEEAAPPAKAGGRSDVAATETVLLVEDDPRVRTSTAAALLELGYTVTEAAGGEEALQELGQSTAIALMLTDIVMPGMNGRQLAEQARKHFPSFESGVHDRLHAQRRRAQWRTRPQCALHRQAVHAGTAGGEAQGRPGFIGWPDWSGCP
jgi:CheY-like chemotaxis protein